MIPGNPASRDVIRDLILRDHDFDPEVARPIITGGARVTEASFDTGQKQDWGGNFSGWLWLRGGLAEELWHEAGTSSVSQIPPSSRGMWSPVFPAVFTAKGLRIMRDGISAEPRTPPLSYVEDPFDVQDDGEDQFVVADLRKPRQGETGVLVGGSDDLTQRALFVPSRRLVSQHLGPEKGKYSEPIYEIKDDSDPLGEIDYSRAAGLHSFTRVVSVSEAGSPEKPKRFQVALWGGEHEDDRTGGAMFSGPTNIERRQEARPGVVTSGTPDRNTTGGGTGLGGALDNIAQGAIEAVQGAIKDLKQDGSPAAQNLTKLSDNVNAKFWWDQGGPLHPRYNDGKRNSYTNEDGEDVSYGGLWTEGYFVFDIDHDGPLWFEKEFHPEDAAEGDTVVATHIQFRRSTERWELWSTSLGEVPRTPEIIPPVIPGEPGQVIDPHGLFGGSGGGPGGPGAGAPGGGSGGPGGGGGGSGGGSGGGPGSQPGLPVSLNEDDWNRQNGVVSSGDPRRNPWPDGIDIGRPEAPDVGIEPIDVQPGADAQPARFPCQASFKSLTFEALRELDYHVYDGRYGWRDRYADARPGGGTGRAKPRMPLSMAMHSRASVQSDGSWQYKELPTSLAPQEGVWRNGTGAHQVLEIGPAALLPDGPESQPWVTESSTVALYSGGYGNGSADATRLGWGVWDPAAGQVTDGPLMGISGGSDTVNMTIDFLDSAGSQRNTGTSSNPGALLPAVARYHLGLPEWEWDADIWRAEIEELVVGGSADFTGATVTGLSVGGPAEQTESATGAPPSTIALATSDAPSTLLRVDITFGAGSGNLGTVTGASGGALLTIYAAGIAFTIDHGGGSTAGDFTHDSGANRTISAGQKAQYVYDDTDDTWRQIT